MKRCSDCGETKPLDDYYRTHHGDLGGYQAHCKQCNSSHAMRWRAANPEKTKEINRRSYLKRRAHLNQKSREYYRTHRDEAIARAKELYQQSKTKRLAKARELYCARREASFQAYGNQCACCGEQERSFLQFDHVNNDGYIHRKTVSPGGRFYLWLEQEGYPPTIQILCANCNHSKRINRGQCAHVLAVHGIEVLETS